jgi:UDP-glucose 4-epimerase
MNNIKTMKLENSRILITGGAGFVGSHLVDQLLAEQVAEIVVLDNLMRGSLRNLAAALPSGRVRFVEGDIRDRALLEKVFPGMDYCFHLAALRITRCADQPREALEVMYDGTFNVIEACVAHQVRKLVVASSASVYGGAEIFPTPESHHPYNNRTLYGAAKMAMELMLRSFADMKGLRYNAMRYFNIYGPRMDTEGKYTEVLIRWYYLLREKKQPIIFGPGDQTMDFVSVEDVARANILALKAEACGEAFNVAAGVETSLNELCYALIKTMGVQIEPRFVPLPEERKAVEVQRRLADTSKASRLIGFDARVTLTDGLRRLVSWLDQQKERVV